MANIPKLGVTGLMDSSGVMDSGDHLHPNVDLFYGPYTSLDQAFNTLKAAEMNVIGVTVGVIDSTGVITEYWLRDATASVADLIPKCPITPEYQLASQSADGLCSAADKAKLSGLNIKSLAYTSLMKTLTINGASVSLRGMDMWSGSVHLADVYSSLAATKDDIASKYANNPGIKIISFKYAASGSTQAGYVLQTVSPSGSSRQHYFLEAERFVVEVDADGEIVNDFVEEPNILAYDENSNSLYLKSSISGKSVPGNFWSTDYCELPLAGYNFPGIAKLSTDDIIPTSQMLVISTLADGRIACENNWFVRQFGLVGEQEILTIDIADIDSLRIIKAINADYWVVKTGKVVGRFFVFDDGMAHKTTQVLITNSSIDGVTTFAHQHRGIGIYYRFFGLTSGDVPAGQWTAWAPLVDTTSVSIALGSFTNVDDACALAATAPYAGNVNIAHMTFFDSSSGRLYVIEQYVSGAKCWQTLIGAGTVVHRTIVLGSTPSPIYQPVSSVGNWTLCSYFGSYGKADASETATAARAAAHAATLTSLKQALKPTTKTAFSGTWANSAFFVVCPKGLYSKVEMQAVTALGTTSYSLAAGTVTKSNASTADFDIFFVSNKTITATNTATMNVTLS